MYIQLTEQCNMSCAHCCFSAPKTRMPQMDRETFVHALALADNYGTFVTIGGGEPTLHEEFKAFVEYAIELKYAERCYIEGDILIITNGKLKGKTSWLLDKIEEEDVPVCVELSRDSFHDPIDPLLVQRFQRHQRSRNLWRPGGNYGKIGIRTVNRILPVGRAIETQVATDFESTPCCCGDIVVAPDGSIYSCGCKHTKLGHVRDRPDLSGYDGEYAHAGGYAPESRD